MLLSPDIVEIFGYYRIFCKFYIPWRILSENKTEYKETLSAGVQSGRVLLKSNLVHILRKLPIQISGKNAYILLLKKLISGPMQNAVSIVPMPTKEVTSGMEPPPKQNSVIPRTMQMASVAILTN